MNLKVFKKKIIDSLNEPNIYQNESDGDETNRKHNNILFSHINSVNIIVLIDNEINYETCIVNNCNIYKY